MIDRGHQPHTVALFFKSRPADHESLANARHEHSRTQDGGDLRPKERREKCKRKDAGDSVRAPPLIGVAAMVFFRVDDRLTFLAQPEAKLGSATSAIGGPTVSEVGREVDAQGQS